MNWWVQVYTAVQNEFSDLLDATQLTQVCVRLFIAVLLGGLLGYDREKNESAAGLRTHMMVALGAAPVSSRELVSRLVAAGLRRRKPGSTRG